MLFNASWYWLHLLSIISGYFHHLSQSMISCLSSHFYHSYHFYLLFLLYLSTLLAYQDENKGKDKDKDN